MYSVLLDGADEPLSVDPGEGVAIVATADGAAFLPASVARMPEDVQSQYLELVDLSHRLFQLQSDIEGLVPNLKALGVTWAGIGWALGIDGDTARKRFGGNDG